MCLTRHNTANEIRRRKRDIEQAKHDETYILTVAGRGEKMLIMMMMLLLLLLLVMMLTIVVVDMVVVTTLVSIPVGQREREHCGGLCHCASIPVRNEEQT